MVLHILRAMFVVVMVAVAWLFLQQLQALAGSPTRIGALPIPNYTWLVVGASLTIGVLIVCVDILAPRRKLTLFSGTFLGLLVGLVIATFRFFDWPIPQIFPDPSFLIGAAVMALILFILIRTPLANPGHPDEPAPPTAMM